jgi:hypothetical protein
VIFLRHYPGTTSDFLISTPGGIIAVCTRRARRLHGTLAEIAEFYRETLALVSAAELFPGILREFWLWSPYGAMRFFRMEGLVLNELDRQGVPLSPPVTGTFAGMKKDEVKSPKKNADGAKPGENFFRKKDPDPETGIKSPDISPPDPGRAGYRESAPVRYLKHRAREMRILKDPHAGPGKEVSYGGIPGAPHPVVGEDRSPP